MCKKALLGSLLLVFASVLSFAQSDTVFYSQDFENYSEGDMIMIDNDHLTPYFSGLTTWQVINGRAISTSYYLDGDRTADDWMITPVIHLGSHPALSWEAFTPDANYRDGYQVLISTDTANPGNLSAYVPVFSILAENTYWTKRTVSLEDYANQAVRIAWRNNSTDKYLLYVDNILVFQKPQRSLELTYASIKPYVPANSQIPVYFKVTNYGVETIDSFQIHYTVNSGDTVTQTITQPLLFAQSYQSSFTRMFSDSIDTLHIIKVWVDNLNGQDDLYNADDTVIKKTSTFSQAYDHKLLIEHFTQASCNPCAQQNPALNSIVANNHDKVVHIAYHTSWPGYDPMYEFNPEESDARVKFYGITGVPAVVVNGKDYLSPGDVSQPYIDNNFTRDAFISVTPDMYHIRNDYYITVKLTPSTYIHSPLYIYTVWIEDLHYDRPPGTNGETDFPDVMRKMFPDANGKVIDSLDKGDTLTLEFVYNKPDEVDIHTSQLVVFVQDVNTKEVFVAEEFPVISMTGVNSLSDKTIKVFPDPATDYITVPLDKFAAAQFEIYDINGKLVKKKTLRTDKAVINVKDLTPGTYLIMVKTGSEVYHTRFVKI